MTAVLPRIQHTPQQNCTGRAEGTHKTPCNTRALTGGTKCRRKAAPFKRRGHQAALLCKSDFIVAQDYLEIGPSNFSQLQLRMKGQESRWRAGKHTSQVRNVLAVCPAAPRRSATHSESSALWLSWSSYLHMTSIFFFFCY